MHLCIKQVSPLQIHVRIHPLLSMRDRQYFGAFHCRVDVQSAHSKHALCKCILLQPCRLHSHVLLPLVDVMRHHFGRIIAIDAPGQGSSPPWIVNTKEDATPWAIIELVYQQLTTLKLKGEPM